MPSGGCCGAPANSLRDRRAGLESWRGEAFLAGVAAGGLALVEMIARDDEGEVGRVLVQIHGIVDRERHSLPERARLDAFPGDHVALVDGAAV